jgi:hypothetical protein
MQVACSDPGGKELSLGAGGGSGPQITWRMRFLRKYVEQEYKNALDYSELWNSVIFD